MPTTSNQHVHHSIAPSIPEYEEQARREAREATIRVLSSMTDDVKGEFERISKPGGGAKKKEQALCSQIVSAVRSSGQAKGGITVIGPRTDGSVSRAEFYIAFNIADHALKVDEDIKTLSDQGLISWGYFCPLLNDKRSNANAFMRFHPLEWCFKNMPPEQL